MNRRRGGVTARVDEITMRAREAYEALCRLEDALDAVPMRLPSVEVPPALVDVWRRWHHDTARKINRAVSARELAP